MRLPSSCLRPCSTAVKYTAQRCLRDTHIHTLLFGPHALVTGTRAPLLTKQSKASSSRLDPASAACRVKPRSLAESSKQWRSLCVAACKPPASYTRSSSHIVNTYTRRKRPSDSAQQVYHRRCERARRQNCLDQSPSLGTRSPIPVCIQPSPMTTLHASYACYWWTDPRCGQARHGKTVCRGLGCDVGSFKPFRPR